MARYLIAFALPPLHFAWERQWKAFTGSLALYLLAWVALLGGDNGWSSGLLAGFLWLIAAAHALWHLRRTVPVESLDPIGREVRKDSETDI